MFLAIDQLLRTFRIPLPQHINLRSSTINFAEIVRRKLYVNRADVLLQAVPLRRAWNRHDPGLLSKNPGECDLSRRGILLFGRRRIKTGLPLRDVIWTTW